MMRYFSVCMRGKKTARCVVSTGFHFIIYLLLFAFIRYVPTGLVLCLCKLKSKRLRLTGNMSASL